MLDRLLAEVLEFDLITYHLLSDRLWLGVHRLRGSLAKDDRAGYVTLVWPVFIASFLPNEVLGALPDYAV